MSDGSDMSDDWGAGQPPPWLDQYGPPPIDSEIAGGPSAADTFGAGAQQPPGAMPPVMESPQGAPVPPQDLGGVAPVGAVPSVGPDARPLPQTGPPGAQQFAPPWAAPNVGGMPSDPNLPDAISGGTLPGQVYENPQAVLARANQPDAITGGELPGQQYTNPAAVLAQSAADRTARATQVATDLKASPADRAAAWQTLTPERRADVINTSDPDKLAAIATSTMSPSELAAITIKHQQAQFHQLSTEQLQRSQQDHEDAQRNWNTYQAMLQKSAADTEHDRAEAKRISQMKIDPGRSPGRFIADIILGGIGGAMSQYTGGKNLALDSMNQRINREIAAQQANIANQWKGNEADKNFVAEQFQRTGDMYRAQETYRISQYDRASAELATKAQDYDPQGTTAIRIANAQQQIAAATDQATRALHQQNFTNSIAKANAGLAVSKEDFDEKNKTGTLANEQWKTAIDAQRAKLEAKKTNAEIGDQTPMGAADIAKRIGPSAFIPPDVAAGGLITPKAYNDMVAMRTKAAEGIKAQTEAVKSGIESQEKENNTIIRNPVTGVALIDPKTKQPTRVDAALAKEANEQTAYAQNAIDSLSEARRILDSDPGLTDRDTYAKLGTAIGTAEDQYIKSLGAKPSSREKDAVKDEFGADFSNISDRVLEQGKGKARIDELIKTMRRNASTNIKATTGADVSNLLLDTSKPTPAKETEADQVTKALAFTTAPGRPNYMQADRADRAFYDAMAEKRSSGVFTPVDDPAVASAIKVGIAPSKIKILDDYKAQSLSKDLEVRRNALDVLDQQSHNEDGAIRDYVQTLIGASADDTLGDFASPDVKPDTATAHEVAP